MSTEEIVAMDHVSFKYGRQNVLDDISLHVKKGSFLGLVGPNGSGKSTLIKLLLGLHKQQDGTIQLFGEDHRRFRGWSRVGFVSQKAASFNSGFPATVKEVVSMGLYGKKGLFRFLTKKDRQRVEEALEKVGMREYKNKTIGQLSGGQQQRVFIARALVSDPELLILDEPTVGVDAESVQNFYTLLKELNEQQGMTLILVTHDIGAMSSYVTDVACLNKCLHYHGGIVDYEENREELMNRMYGHEVNVIEHNHDHHHHSHDHDHDDLHGGRPG
ncbi:metal ABC transporter ATP-binding protein [Alkalicoccus urumqiensis]|uniref:Zinc ABC transporter ATP-binding protein n=1 Tax=Alkalicoccus urumqiensis TaxID=1548213 RepID=A0A2P6MFV4_ALKUR|nr:metal ABC transporter ATP-binding protein [Alkalicoccus urumqiensis]PRO65131.1 zinc ABC transporter ATP-binding protein [Alkalicoccus urumqiensis]